MKIKVKRSPIAFALFLIAVGFIAALLVYAVNEERENYGVVGLLLAGGLAACGLGWWVLLRHNR